MLLGFALVMIISFNEYLISNMVSGFIVETLPIKIFNNIRNGYSPMLAAASIGFLSSHLGCYLLYHILTCLNFLGASMKELTRDDVVDLLFGEPILALVAVVT